MRRVHRLSPVSLRTGGPDAQKAPAEQHRRQEGPRGCPLGRAAKHQPHRKVIMHKKSDRLRAPSEPLARSRSEAPVCGCLDTLCWRLALGPLQERASTKEGIATRQAEKILCRLRAKIKVGGNAHKRQLPPDGKGAQPSSNASVPTRMPWLGCRNVPRETTPTPRPGPLYNAPLGALTIATVMPRTLTAHASSPSPAGVDGRAGTIGLR